MTELAPLPIDAVLQRVAQALSTQGACVVQAEPGAGKTTRIPVDLLDRGALAGEAWVIEPRRMAAVLAARHVAAQRNQPCGETIGFSVRFEDATGPATRVRYATDGIFLRRLASDPQLTGISTVIFDEFHERRLATDLGLAAVRHLRASSRPDLQVLVMSATLDVEEVAQWLGGATVVRASGRQFPVTVEHAATVDQRPLQDQVLAAVRRLLHEGLQGDILCFLPGALEIRRCQEALGRLAADHDLAIRPLHGGLALPEQEQAIAKERRRKVILATNIAETSVTLPGVVAVVDSGLAHVAGHAAWSGLPTLQLQKVSRASAAQRAGRAGRLAPGRCLRLYTQYDGDARPAFDKPEVVRTDLCDAYLQAACLAEDLACARMADEAVDASFWLTPPEQNLVQLAVQTLERLGALQQGRVTALGRALAQLPVHPRLGRLLIEAQRQGITALGVRVAALLGEGNVRGGAGFAADRAAHGDSDLWALLEDEDAVAAGASPRDRNLDLQALQAVRRSRQQLSRLLPGPNRPGVDHDTALGVAVLAAFGDRLARRRQPGQPELEMPGGSRLALGPRSQVTEAPFVVVLDAEERRDARGMSSQVRMAHGVGPELILEALAERVRSSASVEVDKQRAVRVERLTVDGLELDRTVRTATPSPEVAALLTRTVLERGLSAVLDLQLLTQLQLRLSFLREQAGCLDLPPLGDAEVRAAIEEVAIHCTRVDELDGAAILAALQAPVQAARQGQGQRLLDEWAPEFMQLPGGRRLRIHYESDRAPWTSSRLQDFFGLADGPRLAGGRIAVVLHLLAPNQRPVQVTTDLAGFWSRHYPGLRRELGRLYPRHSWPEDPLTAAPPPPNRIR